MNNLTKVWKVVQFHTSQRPDECKDQKEMSVSDSDGEDNMATFSSGEDEAVKKKSSTPRRSKREKKVCPYSTCKKAVINLPRHLKETQKVTRKSIESSHTAKHQEEVHVSAK